MQDPAVTAYFQEPAGRKEMVDLAAAVIAMVQGRDYPTRSDYAHPKMAAVVATLERAGAIAREQAAAKPGRPN